MADDRPTPEEVLDSPTCDWTVQALRDAGIVVGYPDDPQIRKKVLAALRKEAMKEE